MPALWAWLCYLCLVAQSLWRVINQVKNLNVLNPGSSRNYVIAEFGAPVLSEYRDGTRVEIYTFQQGYPKWAKVSRAFGHGIADVASFGLWEVFGTPTEAYFSGKETSYEVTYGQDDLVKALSSSILSRHFLKQKHNDEMKRAIRPFSLSI